MLEFKQRIVNKRREEMSKKLSLYNEIKATQVACLLLGMNGGEMNYVKCIKLLYSIEREALKRWMRPVFYDDLCSMPYGQVVSQTLDRAEYRQHKAKSYWGDHIENDGRNNLRLIKECSINKLSRAEIELVEEIFDKNKYKDADQLFKDHHNPKLFPEYVDPHGSSKKTTYPYLLQILGKTSEEIKDFEDDIDEMKYLEEIKR